MPLAPIAANTLGSDCPILLHNLGQYACSDPATKRSRLALLGDMGVFNSPLYTGFSSLQSELITSGKVRSVRLQLLKRACDTDLDDCATVDECTAGTTDPYDEYLVEFDPVCSVAKVTVSIRDFERTCTGVETGTLQRIQRVMDALLRDHEQKLMAQIIAGAGGNVVGPVAAGGYRTVPAVINENGLLNATAVHTIVEDMLDNEADDCAVIALGGLRTALGKLDTIRQLGCCNDFGVDQQAAADALGIAFFKSKQVEAAFTAAGATNPADSIALMHPGSVHPVEWYRYGGDGEFVHGLSMGTVYTDPVSGVSFDMKVQFDDCTETYIFTISKQTMAYTLPTDMYQDCDPLTDVNGIWLYDLEQCPPAECPAPAAP